ncbi:MAG: FAD:protein FMN transferase [Saprospiraceae bacterium]|nr:FAD:protein FMN transferase [Saprospiraceae bacterium]
MALPLLFCRMIQRLYFALLLVGFFASCQNDKTTHEYRTVEGKTMGTYFKVTYQDSLNRDFFKAIDSMLVQINHEISTYEPNSTISQFNKSATSFELGMDFRAYSLCLANPSQCGKVRNYHFYKNLVAARVANQQTNHAFDPTVMPLVNYWGFGYTPQKAVEKVDSLKVDSLMQFVGFEKVAQADSNGFVVLNKTLPGVQLDFGGTGQGYAIDAIAIFLELQGIKNYLVDIGGESRARGKNHKGEWWTIGVNTPKPEAGLTEFTKVIKLENKSVSTSGNYRNFHEVNGSKYSHIIDPRTGYPRQSNLLSVSVFAENCLEPDALATSFMVLGLDKAYELASQMKGIEAMFIYSDEKGNLQIKQTPGVAKMLVE